MGDESTALTLQAAREIQKAWERFVAGEDTRLLEKVRPPIQASWRRSRDFGVDPTARTLPLTLEPEAVDRKLRQHACLAQAGREVFAFVSSLLHADAFVVGVTDNEGNLLYTDAPPQFDWRAEMNVFPGAGLQEHAVGTNAVSLALHLNQPFQTYWYEHYAEVGHRAGGGAIPIHSSCGDTLGTLAIAGYGESAHPRVFHLLAFAAGLLKEKIRHAEELAHFSVLQEFNRACSRYPESLLLALCPHGRILALSQSLAKLVTLQPPERLIGRSLHEVRDFHLEEPFSLAESDCPAPYESRLRFVHKDKSCASTVIPVSREGQSAGLVVIASGPGSSAAKTISKPLWQAAHTFSDLIGHTPVFRSVVELARQAAAHDWPILLIGESGTGKELFAHAIHQASRRTRGPFVALNLSTTPKELASAELFGYEEGAFSGALRGGKRGKVELAHGGTLFLDELGDLPIEIQAGLLRFLEEGTIVPLGGDRPRRVDVRVIAAMNLAPTLAVEQGKLRLDLFHRLNVFPLFLPPLRARREDVSLLARALLDKEGFSAIAIAPDVMELFRHYAWPGNIRELRNVLICAAVRSSQGLITRDLLPSELLKSQPPAGPPPTSSRQVGREQLQQALRQCNGNLTHAAQLLHIHRATFYRKMQQYGLTREDVTD
ncbi:MAG TPA: sigma 54-interacting transcriptional regulator [Methylomirabilota bacterium]|nr:sigma 54-interacting transcriptional regulator [Methylomirabilota bacterium]